MFSLNRGADFIFAPLHKEFIMYYDSTYESFTNDEVYRVDTDEDNCYLANYIHQPNILKELFSIELFD